MTHDIDAQALACVTGLLEAAETHPVHRRRDLLRRGISDSLHVAMIRRGHLVRLRHGVYAVRSLVESAGPAERHRIDAAAAVAGGVEPAWAFGPTAALLRGMPLPFECPDRISLARSSGADERALRRPSRHRLVLPGTSITTGPIPPDHSVVRGVPCVAPSLTAISTAVELTSARWRTALFDAALWRGATRDQLEREITLWRQLGHRTELLAALARARPGAQTVLETFSRLALVEGGLPEPILQQAFSDADGLIGYADMWWPTLRVIGEADGLGKYATRADLLAEKRREDRLRALGHAVVRWTFEDIEQHPDRVVAAITRAGRRAA